MLTMLCGDDAVHDVMDPEYSILKQRLARRVRAEGTSDVASMDIVGLTKVSLAVLQLFSPISTQATEG